MFGNLGGTFTFQYASIKPFIHEQITSIKNKFTFQYASIKPEGLAGIEMDIQDLHFNMLLLNRVPSNPTAEYNSIYISICFY